MDSWEAQLYPNPEQGGVITPPPYGALHVPKVPAGTPSGPRSSLRAPREGSPTGASPVTLQEDFNHVATSGSAYTNIMAGKVLAPKQPCVGKENVVPSIAWTAGKRPGRRPYLAQRRDSLNCSTFAARSGPCMPVHVDVDFARTPATSHSQAVSAPPTSTVLVASRERSPRAGLITGTTGAAAPFPQGDGLGFRPRRSLACSTSPTARSITPDAVQVVAQHCVRVSLSPRMSTRGRGSPPPLSPSAVAHLTSGAAQGSPKQQQQQQHIRLQQRRPRLLVRGAGRASSVPSLAEAAQRHFPDVHHVQQPRPQRQHSLAEVAQQCFPGTGDAAASAIRVPTPVRSLRSCWSSGKLSRPPRRIILTSSGLTTPSFMQAFLALLTAKRPNGSPKVLYVPDAAVCHGCCPHIACTALARQLLPFGIPDIRCIELRQTKQEALAQELENADCVFVEQGNTFFLRYYMHASGFDKLVPPLVLDSGLVYAGASAGSVCAGRTINTSFWKGWDCPGYGKEWDLQHLGYDGLDILPGRKSVFPHHGPQWQALVESRQQELDHEVVLLDEDHAFVVDGDREELLPAHAQTMPAPRRVSPAPATPLASRRTCLAGSARRLPLCKS